MIPSLKININLNEYINRDVLEYSEFNNIIFFEICLDDKVIINSEIMYSDEARVLNTSLVFSDELLANVTEKIILENIKDLLFNNKSHFNRIISERPNEILRSNFENHYFDIIKKSLVHSDEVDFNYFKDCINKTLNNQILDVEKIIDKEINSFTKTEIIKNINFIVQDIKSKSTIYTNDFNNKISKLIDSNKNITALNKIQEEVKINLSQLEIIKNNIDLTSDLISKNIKSNNLVDFYNHYQNYLFLENDYKEQLNSLKYQYEISNEIFNKIDHKNLLKVEIDLMQNLVKEIKQSINLTQSIERKELKKERLFVNKNNDFSIK